ncbi:hypothetical protein ACIHCQ_18955 [Streptomyces sp. NPDC052236]|uniref:hypothetical protein n=1 Tax=Streptomyces sp. NPDC052236 TaxID=3365686 RepID=UPI0037D3DF32
MTRGPALAPDHTLRPAAGVGASRRTGVAMALTGFIGWYAVIALLVLTRFWPYWSSLL